MLPVNLEQLGLHVNFSKKERRYFDTLKAELLALFGADTYEQILADENTIRLKQISDRLAEMQRFVATKRLPESEAADEKEKLVPLEAVQKLKTDLESKLGGPVEFFDSWDHITMGEYGLNCVVTVNDYFYFVVDGILQGFRGEAHKLVRNSFFVFDGQACGIKNTSFNCSLPFIGAEEIRKIGQYDCLDFRDFTLVGGAICGVFRPKIEDIRRYWPVFKGVPIPEIEGKEIFGCRDFQVYDENWSAIVTINVGGQLQPKLVINGKFVDVTSDGHSIMEAESLEVGDYGWVARVCDIVMWANGKEHELLPCGNGTMVKELDGMKLRDCQVWHFRNGKINGAVRLVDKALPGQYPVINGKIIYSIEGREIRRVIDSLEFYDDQISGVLEFVDGGQAYVCNGTILAEIDGRKITRIFTGAKNIGGTFNGVVTLEGVTDEVRVALGIAEKNT